jgi:tetratricopeptide (TPR) repeat protein
MALAPHEGQEPVDEEIRQRQQQVRSDQNREAALERLGWAFVTKARQSFDPGYYKLAEACARALENDSPGSSAALLLRGHVLENLHCFKEAERLARELVSKRGLSFDYALLGDSLLEQGRLQEAVSVYQTMIDLRPDLHSYSRAANVRWLTGDLDGAIEMMQLAVRASSPQDADSSAWVNSRLAGYHFQAGHSEEAHEACSAALALRPNYPPALLLQGRMLLAQGDFTGAVESFELAAKANPLPEYQWGLVEALRANGRDDEATDCENRLRSRGAITDPRTLALYLATRGEDIPEALRLAQEELTTRADVFTQDALAWALTAAGRLDEARVHLNLALAEGTQDARLFFHAAVISFQTGQINEAEGWFARAIERIDSLLPSEQHRLEELAESLATSLAQSNESEAAAAAISASGP